MQISEGFCLRLDHGDAVRVVLSHLRDDADERERSENQGDYHLYLLTKLSKIGVVSASGLRNANSQP